MKINEYRMNYEEIMKLALERGFYVPSCEIYADSPAGFWDYGHLGTALRNRFVDLWRRELLRRDNMFEIDGSQVMSKNVFIASGHIENFVDPIVNCGNCDLAVRADRLITEKTRNIIPERLKNEEYDHLLKINNIKCPKCNSEFGKVQKFNMMFKLGIGATNEETYLRPETCQSIFVDFPRLFKIMRGKLPFSIAQFGKSFRNEISPRQSLMRLREFYQAEIEVFFNQENSNNCEKFEEIKNYELRLFFNEKILDVTCDIALKRKYIPSKLVGYYLALIQQFYEVAGIDKQKIRLRILQDDEKAFYAKSAYDLEVNTSLGWIELVACNDRGTYDLSSHSKLSKKDMMIMDKDTKVLPSVFELSLGVDRSLYCILEHSYVKESQRNLLKIKHYLAPIQVGIFPLVNRDELPTKAKEVHDLLKKDFLTIYDYSGSIGRRYRRLDEVGVPLGITIDYDTLKDNTVTLRERDKMQQIRVKINNIQKEIRDFYNGKDLFKL
jgi:glycyl-tRNA synthetase